MKQPIIICGFPGVGKTACAKYARVLDAESSAYSHIIDPVEMTRRENDAFPTNYIDMVETEVKSDRWDIILLSSHKIVRDELKQRCLRFIAVCPKEELLDEYMARYLRRGSSYEFIAEIRKYWSMYISGMMTEEVVIQLEKGQYLKDILPLF